MDGGRGAMLQSVGRNSHLQCLSYFCEYSTWWRIAFCDCFADSYFTEAVTVLIRFWVGDFLVLVPWKPHNPIWPEPVSFSISANTAIYRQRAKTELKLSAVSAETREEREGWK